MKKSLSIVLSLIMLTVIFAGCTNSSGENSGTDTDKTSSNSSVSSEGSKEATKTHINIGVLKGPTAMGMVKLMNDAESGKTANDYTFEIDGAVDEVTPKIVKGDFDIAAVPANLASVLYNNTDGKVSVLAVNTLGVLYIVETGNDIKSVADLRGKTIYASGKGATPEYSLNYILKANGIDPEKDVNIEFKSEHSECVAALAKSDNAIALLPQPFVTSAQAQNDKIRIALDLNEEWEKAQADSDSKSALITGVIVVRNDFLKDNRQAVNDFLDEYKASTEYVNSNIDDASALIEKYNIIKATVAKKALPYCNITFIEGSQMKTQLGGYLAALFEQNPKAVGGKLPNDEFYYTR